MWGSDGPALSGGLDCLMQLNIQLVSNRIRLLAIQPSAPNDYRFPAILKTGRYMAITRPPMTTPKKTSMKGSIKEVRFSTA